MTFRHRLCAGGTIALSLAAAIAGCKSSGGGTSTPQRGTDPAPALAKVSRNDDSGGGRLVSAAVAPPPTGTFVESFTWKGNHAAVINGGKGTAIHWNADSWDVTGDTHAIAVMGEWSDTPSANAGAAAGTPSEGLTNTNSGHAVYVHKAASACDAASTAPCDSLTDDTSLVAGGDGSPGVGLVHMDLQDIVGMRLRNPMVVSETKPGIVRLRAPRFVTTGHWWEIALTPADTVIGSENTIVESQGLYDGLGDPGDPPNSAGKGAGPGHDPQEPSYNLVVSASSDFACDDMSAEQGTLTRIAVKSVVKDKPAGATTAYQTVSGNWRYNMYNLKSFHNGVFFGDYQRNLIRPGLDGRNKLAARFLDGKGNEDYKKVAAANIADQHKLYLWQFELKPSGTVVKADFNDGRGLAVVETFTYGVPWKEVHVALMGSVYQNDHHPQVQDCFVPNPYTKRDIAFRTVQISPVKYEKTWVFPADGAPVDASGNVTGCGGSCGRWARYDMRDTHNWGAADTVNGVALPKANKASFKFALDYAHGSTNRYSGGTNGGLPPEKSFDLYVPLTDDVKSATNALFVYNVLGWNGRVTMTVNGHDAGALLTGETVPGSYVRNDVSIDDPGSTCAIGLCESVRRSVPIATSLLTQDAKNGVAHIQITFDQSKLGPSGIFLDRMQLELMK